MLINFWPWLLYDIDFTTPFIVFSSVSKKLFKIFFYQLHISVKSNSDLSQFSDLDLLYGIDFFVVWHKQSDLMFMYRFIHKHIYIDLRISCIYSVLILSKASFSKVYMDWYSALCYLCFSLIVSRREGYNLTGRL